MTEAKLINEDSKLYRNKFKVEIDLEGLPNKEIEILITDIRTAINKQGVVNIHWLMQILNYMEGKN